MRLVDTSAWIERLVDSPIGRTIAGELPARNDWLVPTIVQFELAKWLTRNVGEDKADQVVAYSVTCNVAILDTAIALQAAELSARFKLATADAVVYVTAISHDADLLTCDRHFEGLPGVRYIAKSAGA